MKNITKNLTLFSHDDLSYGFDDGGPTLRFKIHDYPYGNSARVDPFPCYTHDIDLVKKEAEHIEKIISLPVKPQVFILPFECTSRTNGTACENHVFVGEKTVMRPFIYLSGKRIPIHPAMTRYLVAHEYGHIIDYSHQFLNKMKGEEFRKEYAKMRKIKPFFGYGALKWHKNIGEIIANDIRVVLFEREIDFWPHPVKHPLECPKVKMFWKKVAKEFQ